MCCLYLQGELYRVVSFDDVDLDQISVDFVLNCARKGGLLELSEAIRDYHDSTLFPHMISEAMDVRTRLDLLNAMVGKEGKRMDTILIPLKLLCYISRIEFSGKKSYIKWKKRQLNMLEEGLINHPIVGFGEFG